MAPENRPRQELASKTLAAPLRAALEHIFKQGISGSMLVGGTALAGYYAAHRRSDDIDIFTEGPHGQEAAVLAVESLAGKGALLLTIGSHGFLEVAANGGSAAHLTGLRAWDRVVLRES